MLIPGLARPHAHEAQVQPHTHRSYQRRAACLRDLAAVPNPSGAGEPWGVRDFPGTHRAKLIFIITRYLPLTLSFLGGCRRASGGV